MRKRAENDEARNGFSIAKENVPDTGDRRGWEKLNRVFLDVVNVELYFLLIIFKSLLDSYVA